MQNESDVKRYLETGKRRVERLQARLRQASRKLSGWRVVTFLVTLGLFIGLSEVKLWPMAFGVLGLGIILFGWLVKRHQRVRLQLLRCARAHQLKRHDLARLQLHWDEIPALPPEDSPAGHPFEHDLDITGPHSLLRLLHTCLSVEGGQRLKAWLLTREPNLAEIATRQARVAALRPQQRLRENLHLQAAEAAAAYRQPISEGAWHSRQVLDLLTALPQRKPLLGLISLGLLAGLNLSLFGLATAGLVANRAWQLSLIVYILAFALQRQQIANLFGEAFGLQYNLYRLQNLFGIFESFAPSRPTVLRDLLQPFEDSQHKPSALIRRLNRIVGVAGLQGNMLIWAAVHLIAPWDFYAAWRLEQLKPELKAHLPRWLDSFWELEALSALAHYGWLHPQAPFPSFHNPGLKTTGLGHPLLPAQGKVRNDFELQQLGQGFLITGSNMAGKSTFLKALGLNQVLAQAGCVVDAVSFSSGPARIFTCIRVSDSVTDGLSYFYAEVKRLKALLDAIEVEHPLPVLFLVDEIFKGTNNRERLIGSRAYIQALTGKRALGGVSTHDLELVQLADHNPLLQNYHFRERIAEQRMVFDYTLQPGPCPTTNALRIMALEGLPVESPDTES